MSADSATVTHAGRTVLSVGPQDVDSAAEVTRNLGVHNKAHQLLQRHARMYPAALRTALSRPVDGDRSQFLREHSDLLSEVEGAAAAVKGRRSFFPAGGKVLSADVRGDDNVGRIFAILFVAPSGRTARGVINYDAVPAVERQFSADRARATEAAPEASGEAAGTDAERADLEARLTALEAELTAARAENADLQERVEVSPEPFEGYDELNATDAIARIKDGGYLEFGKQGLEQIIAYEDAQDKPRKTVIEAAQEALDAIPAEAADSDEA